MMIRTSLIVALFAVPAAPARAGFESAFPSTVEGLVIPNAHDLKLESKGRVIRGMAPRHEQDIRDLIALGVEDILAFKQAWKDEVNEGIALLKEMGYKEDRLHHIPFRWKYFESFQKPCRQTLEAVKILRDAERDGRTVFFHCTVGEDRTGYLAAVYRLLAQGRTAEDVFQNEMCLHGYGAGNPQKPVERVVLKIRRELTPLYLKMAYLVSIGAVTLDNLDGSACAAEPSEAAVGSLFDEKDFRCETSPRYPFDAPPMAR
ncbi:MAG: tyrosine-protein phosphatase [Elusimicrobiota bacterium]